MRRSKLTDKILPQVYADDPIHRIAAELSRADSSSHSKAKSHTANRYHHHHHQSGGGPLSGALFRRPRPHHRGQQRPRRPRRSVLDEEYFPSSWSSNSWKQRRKPPPPTAPEKRGYSGHQGGGHSLSHLSIISCLCTAISLAQSKYQHTNKQGGGVS